MPPLRARERAAPHKNAIARALRARSGAGATCTHDHHREVRWSVILPLKPPQRGKSRLRGAGDDEAAHVSLVLAFAQDALAAALQCESVIGAVLVCDAETAAAVLHAGLDGPSALLPRDRARVIVTAEAPGEGLNGAVRAGQAAARSRWPDAATAALLPDVPAVDAASLDRALLAAAAHPRSYVPDHDGGGTTMLCALPGIELRPMFGVGSAAAHAQSGAAELDADARLRLDVDTRADLAANLRLGVGPATAAVLGANAPVPPPGPLPDSRPHPPRIR